MDHLRSDRKQVHGLLAMAVHHLGLVRVPLLGQSDLRSCMPLYECGPDRGIFRNQATNGSPGHPDRASSITFEMVHIAISYFMKSTDTVLPVAEGRADVQVADLDINFLRRERRKPFTAPVL